MFSFRHVDRTGCAEFKWPPSSEHHDEVWDFLQSISGCTWNEIYSQITSTRYDTHRKHHSQDFDTVCPDAQRRIAAMRLDERFNELFRFRLGGRKRLWGCISDQVFHVVWWDPDHRVYPTEPA